MTEQMSIPPSDVEEFKEETVAREAVASEEPIREIQLDYSRDEVIKRLSEMFAPDSPYCIRKKRYIASMIDFKKIDDFIDPEDVIQHVAEKLWRRMRNGVTLPNKIRPGQNSDEIKDRVFYAYANVTVDNKIRDINTKSRRGAKALAEHTVSTKKVEVNSEPSIEGPTFLYENHTPLPEYYLDNLEPGAPYKDGDFTTLDNKDVQRIYGGFRESNEESANAYVRDLVDLQKRSDYQEICKELCIIGEITFKDKEYIRLIKIDAYLRDLSYQQRGQTREMSHIYRIAIVHLLAGIDPQITMEMLNCNMNDIYVARNRGRNWLAQHISPERSWNEFGLRNDTNSDVQVEVSPKNS